MQAVILAAGKGLRLRPLTETTPKALVDVGGMPLIFHILASLPEAVAEIFVVTGHLGEQIVSAVGDSFRGRPVRYVTQAPLDGTGSALTVLRTQLRETFLVVNGDDLYEPSDLGRLAAHDLSILVLPTTEPVENSARIGPDGRFAGLEPHVPDDTPKLRVCGAYVLDTRFFDYPLATVSVHGKTEYSLPHTLVAMARDHRVAVEQATWWQPVGTPEELEKARGGIKGGG